MKKSKFLILTGAVTLAVISFYGRKPYATATTIKCNTYGELFTGGSSSYLTTVNPLGGTTAGKTAFFRTSGSGNSNTWNTMKTASGTKLYFNVNG
jgi:hypothetical protein